MLKRIIRTYIFNDYYEIKTASTTQNKKQIHNIVKRTLSKILKKQNKTLDEYVKSNQSIKVCRNCNNLALYDFDYTVQINDTDIVYIAKTIKYENYENYEKLYCGKCLKSYNANSKKYVSIIYGVSESEANNIILNRNRSPFYRNNFKSNEEYKKSQSRDKNFYIKKYGKRGEKIYQDNIKKWYNSSNDPKHRHKKDSMSLKFHKNKYGEEEGAEKYIIRKSTVSSSLKSLILKYGEEEGIKRYTLKIKKLAYNNTLECYIKKYGEKEGKLKYKNWKTKCKVSLSSFIKKYGEKEGKKRYKKWLIGVTSNSSFFYSKESFNFFNELNRIFPDLTFMYGTNERFIYDKTGNFNGQKIFYYDCYIKELNLLIEYDTLAYHPNPCYLSEENLKKCKGGDFNKDIYKENLCKEQRYNYYKIFIASKKERLESLKNIIKYIYEHK